MGFHLAVFSLWAPDVPLTAHFYRDVIGLPLIHQHGDRPHFLLEQGSVLVIMQGRPVPALDPQPERFPLFALQVEDLDAAINRLRQHQVELPWGIESGPGSRWIMFHDPAGNLVELVEMANDSRVSTAGVHDEI